MSLSIGQIIAISITATAASIGAAGIPQVNKRIWNGNGWKIMFPYFFSRLAWWRWWWCSRRWDFLLRTSPSSWPSTGSSTGYQWWGWRQLDTDVQFLCIFVSRNHFSMLFHSCVVKESWKLAKDWICLQVPNNNQRAWRLPWGRHRLPPQQGRTWRFRKTAHQVSLVPSDTTFVRWLAQLGENTWQNLHQARWWRLWVGANDRCWGERTPGKMRQRSENFGEAFCTKWHFETYNKNT